MHRLEGKVAIVTGAADGIGAAIARRLAVEGAAVLLGDVDDAAGRATAAAICDTSGADARYVHADVGVKAEVVAMVDAALEAWGTVHVLVNNAWGGGTLSRVERKRDEDLAHGMALNYFGPFWAMQSAFAPMKAQGWGRVVNLCSLNGVNAHVGSLEYNASKEALRTLTRTAAREWAPWGITCNAICPGAKSSAFRNVMAQHPELEAAADAGNPMGRIGDPDADIAPVAAFLASEDARYLTGNTLFVDGGGHINGVAWTPVLPD